MPFVYILRCGDGSLYTGVAQDLAARLRKHGQGRASRYTRARLPVTLVWSREVASWGDGLREEHRIKRLRRPDKEALVAGAAQPTASPSAPTRERAEISGLAARSASGARTRAPARKPRG